MAFNVNDVQSSFFDLEAVVKLNSRAANWPHPLHGSDFSGVTSIL
jgi:hypothetical protein